MRHANALTEREAGGEKNWSRLAMDITHYDKRHFLTHQLQFLPVCVMVTAVSTKFYQCSLPVGVNFL